MNYTAERQLAMTCCVIGFAMTVGCAGHRAEVSQDREVEAEHVVDEYLAQSAVRSGGPADPSLFSCDDIGASSNLLALARHKVLGSLISADTVLVEAQVTTVGRVRLALDGYHEVIPSVSTDTLSWRLIRRPDGQWGVCGYSLDGGVDFVRLGHLGPRVRWLNGSSMESLQASADSVTAVRNDGY